MPRGRQTSCERRRLGKIQKHAGKERLETSFEAGVEDERDKRESMKASMTAEQRIVFGQIMAAVELKNGGFFVHGSGGTGKTYLWNKLTTTIR